MTTNFTELLANLDKWIVATSPTSQLHRNMTGDRLVIQKLGASMRELEQENNTLRVIEKTQGAEKNKLTGELLTLTAKTRTLTQQIQELLKL